MQIIIKNKRCSIENLKKEYPNCIIFDVTSKGDMKTLSPFYPHGDIPIPGISNITSQSVEGVWQGLKVFQNFGIDIKSFQNNTMKNLKRTVKKYGKPLGHQLNNQILDYITARKQIYVPTYNWILEHKCQLEISNLKKLSKTHTIIFLDYDTNENIDDPTKPLSHASLIKNYITK